MGWTDSEPTKSGYYWAVGVPFYNPVIVRIVAGVRSEKNEDGTRRYWSELNASFPEYKPHMWKGDVWPEMQWCGPIPMPKNNYRPVVHPLDALKQRMGISKPSTDSGVAE
jgi:hypothetical protein